MAEASSMMMVPFDNIEIGVVENHREDMGDIAGLADSIIKNGLLEPPVVLYKHYGGSGFLCPDGSRVFSRHILVSGHRRLAAIGMIRKRKPGSFEKVPVVLFKGNETDAKLAQLAENVDRKSMTPVELANSFRELLNVGLTQSAIAKHTRLSDSYISTLLGIRERCSMDVLRALSAGEITIETAGDLSKLNEKAQAAQLDKYRGTKKEKGKQAAKRETKKDTGGKARGSLREAEKVIPLVITKIRKIGEGDVAKARWRGAMEMVDYLVGNNDQIMKDAEALLQTPSAPGDKE